MYVVIAMDDWEPNPEYAIGPFTDVDAACGWIVSLPEYAARYADAVTCWHENKARGEYEADKVPPTPQEWYQSWQEDGGEWEHQDHSRPKTVYEVAALTAPALTDATTEETT